MCSFLHVLVLACILFGMCFFRYVLLSECALSECSLLGMCSKWRVIKIGWSHFRVILIFEKRLISAWINVRRGANQLSLKQASAFIIWHTRRWLHAPLLLLLRSLAASQPPYWPQDWGCSTPRSQRKHARSLQPPTAKLYRPPAIRFFREQFFLAWKINMNLRHSWILKYCEKSMKNENNIISLKNHSWYIFLISWKTGLEVQV